MIIKRCTATDNSCSYENADKNFICFLPDGSSPEDTRLEIQSSSNAGGKKDYLHIYQTGFFNNGERM